MVGLLAKTWAQIVRLFFQRTVLILGVLFGAGVLSLFWYQDMLQSRLLESALLHDAARYSRAITEFRTLYTAKVVEVVRPHGIEVTHDVEGKDNAIPLPIHYIHIHSVVGSFTTGKDAIFLADESRPDLV